MSNKPFGKLLKSMNQVEENLKKEKNQNLLDLKIFRLYNDIGCESESSSNCSNESDDSAEDENNN